MRFAYADPPYPGRARRLYGCDEVDHARLIAFLLERFPDGWALSTAEDALRDLLPLCPPPPLTHVCPWVKPIAPSSRTHGLHTCWEPLIVVGGRRRPPGRRDWLRAQPARFGGTLVGRKPLAFCAWLFDCLGAVAGDELVDLFPGTGIVGRAWAQVSPAAADDASFLPPHCLKKNGTPAARHSKRGHLYYLVFAGPKEKGAEIASHILGGGEKIK